MEDTVEREKKQISLFLNDSTFYKLPWRNPSLHNSGKGLGQRQPLAALTRLRFSVCCLQDQRRETFSCSAFPLQLAFWPLVWPWQGPFWLQLAISFAL